MTTPRKTKVPATKIEVPQSKEQVNQYLASIADLQARRDALVRETEAKINTLRQGLTEPLADIERQETALAKGVQIWCDANRLAMTQGGKKKTITFNTGEVNWHKRPPSVDFKRGSKVEEIIQKLKTLKLFEIVRTKEEVNKEAILALPKEPTSESDGLTQQYLKENVPEIVIKTDVEDFNIVPFHIKPASAPIVQPEQGEAQ